MLDEHSTTDACFFDTYALVELLKRNPIYQTYAGATIVTTKLNLFEVYEILLSDYSCEIADRFLETYYPLARKYNLNNIRQAVLLKQSHRKLSMTDCVGYALARQLSIPFLTGDSVFQGMEGVEYVK
ncbi:MAG: PIN domain-containing protein [Nanoarchaeota archaeon]